MPTVNTNVYTILNSAVSEAMGTTVTQISAGNFVDFGRTTMSQQATADVIFGKLVDRIAKTAVMNRVYNSKWKSLLVTEMEYGAVLQRIRIEPMAAEADESFVVNDDLTADEVTPFIVKLPDVVQTLFTDFKAYQFHITITKKQMKSAFTSEAALAAFIEGIYTAVANSVELYIERAVRLAVNTFMAEKYRLSKLAGNTRSHAFNIYAAWKALPMATEFNSVEQALSNRDFLLWTTQFISDKIKEMSELSTVFVTGDVPTSVDDPTIIALARYITAVNTNVASSSFNVDKLSILSPSIEVSGWQAAGKADLSMTYSVGSNNYSVTNIFPIALVYDRRALGATVFDHTTDTIYNPRRQYYNDWEHITCGYFADLAEAACLFYMDFSINDDT